MTRCNNKNHSPTGNFSFLARAKLGSQISANTFIVKRLTGNRKVTMPAEVKKTPYEMILPIWEQFLWPDRTSPIKKISPISKELCFNPEINQSIPTFWGLFVNKNELVGSISGFKTEAGFYRSRGLYISERYRGLNFSSLLFKAICSQALLENCHTVWSLPRHTAWHCYKKFGFIQKSDWFVEKMEFGPNCLAELSLNRLVAQIDKTITEP